MSSEIKYVVLGLLIGMAATAIVAVAVFFSVPQIRAYSAAASPSALPVKALATDSIALADSSSVATPTFTSVPTLIVAKLPAATDLPLLTPTPDAVQSMVNSGGLAFAGPLTNAQQLALYRASLNYAETTVADSKRMAKAINGVGYGDPTNICGPLAIAILRDAGLMTPQIIPHDFWLLNPPAPTDARLLKLAFPPDQFDYSKTSTPINKIDWRSAPLLPGDFLFIWHGSGGNFDHMLVVSRVDNAGRTYAVTNYGTPAGFIIAETMLYDPNDPTAGIFYTWTKQREAILGSTGFGGFELWRRKSP